MAQDPQSAALLEHIFSQTQANVMFLESQNYISAPEAKDILSRLTAAQDRSGHSVDSGAMIPVPSVAPAGRRSFPPPSQARLNQARALWAYNEDGREANDLSFSSGEIVEIIDENNADWWTGKCRGRQGLFPSNHVEKINASSPAPAPPPFAPPPTSAPVPYAPPAGLPPPGPPVGYGNDRPVYKPFGATYQGINQPPPPGSGAVNNVGLQQAQAPAEPKKNRFGGLGSTMANSAAGGVGFGAGK
ncbi:SH3 domain-containing protein [Irpex rosettiformis]|uniref:SH3 domain-containing protein n=1 Tax=Irpex rosettiformis TaxID=378272 RepID=A0ACB8U7D8_9APHY|nr:SH3 domain-containing protein [Irpex rosettiformis]